MKGKSLIPRLGDRSVREELDRLFSREVLGSILMGSAIGKVVEKANNIILAGVILWILDVELTTDMWLGASVLFIIWSIESFIFILLYLKWDEYMKAIEESKDKAKEKASTAKDKVKPENKDSETKTFV